ncbi:MAG: ACT domain-containing protein, partial [Actinomycetota bacterium]|nr:ACT domain-containing protein [Actinomycetota bacterium]
GELMLYGRGAGGLPTASAVLGDLIDASHNLRAGGSGRTTPMERATIHPVDEICSQYYLSLEVADRPGVARDVFAVVATHGVSIRAMEQEGLGEEARLILITHLAPERAVQATIADLRELDAVDRIGTLLRVVGQE